MFSKSTTSHLSFQQADGRVPLQLCQRQFNLILEGEGFGGIEWCPTSGCYLIVAGPANGGPLKNETGRETFALYSWDGTSSAEVCIPDLSGYAVRPESIEIIEVNGEPRVLFVEDRFKAEDYNTRNAVHWPITILD